MITRTHLTLAGTLIAASSLLGSIASAVDVPVMAGALVEEVVGEVVVVNPEARMLTIREPSGVFLVIHVPEEVRRLDEIRINDQLTIDYLTAVAVDLQKGGDAASAPGAAKTLEVERGTGRAPSGSLTETITLVGIVDAIDRTASQVTVRGPQNRVTVSVENPDLLSDVDVGDSVTVNYINAVAARIDRASGHGSMRPGGR
ncbi:hypothetical protein CKO25_13505 [Thiocapsa imhoffii]|uniref:DUF5666 domain-containing protein n=1 Tax=Thiocapsa imhoffii TaxID=382777 RepID=A0A9X0WJ31_9GAMM|nr:hypothetical protein [Thiocapsa imhoffii]MBK1645644.1 hypothetical protein [Thiocapsa imhoffii]